MKHSDWCASGRKKGNDKISDRPTADSQNEPLKLARIKTVKEQHAAADAVIEYAKKIRDWPLLEQAVEQKMEDQAEFVRSWDENVRPSGRPKNPALIRASFLLKNWQSTRASPIGKSPNGSAEEGGAMKKSLQYLSASYLAERTALSAR